MLANRFPQSARPRTLPLSATALAVALLGSSAAPGIRSAYAADPASPLFVDRVEVELVDFEVVVRDGDRVPVAGLGRDDFEVIEDGAPVEITHFLAYAGGLSVTEAEAAGGVGEPPERRLHLAVLVEGLSGAPRSRAFEALRRQLAGWLHPDDRVMVAQVDGALDIEQRFTGDQALVMAALDRLEKRAFATSLEAERRRLITDLSRALEPPRDLPDIFDSSDRDTRKAEAESLLRRMHAFAGESAAHSRRNLDAVGRLASSLAGLPGRKAVLLLSGGFEMRPGEELFSAWDSKFGSAFGAQIGAAGPMAEAERYDLGEVVRRLAADANAARVTIYGLAAGADRAASMMSAEMGTRLSATPLATSGGDPAGGLLLLADSTGGSAIAAGSGAAALFARMDEDFSTYYALGYPRSHPRPGEEHRVVVRVRRPGLEVRHRQRYRSKSAAERIVDGTLAALLHDVTDNPLGIRVELGDAAAEKRDRYLLPVVIRVPLAKILLLPHDASHRGALTVVVAVQDERGRMSEPRRMEVPVEIPNDRLLTALMQDLGYQLELQVRGGEQKLAVGVVDELAAVSSTLNLTIPVAGG